MHKCIWGNFNRNYKVDGIAFNVDLLNQTPDPVRAGDIVELKFSTQNRGNESVNDLNVLLDYSYPFSAVPGEDISKTITKIFAYNLLIMPKLLNLNCLLIKTKWGL